MNDLNQLLRDAAGSGDGDRLNPHDLLASGRKKVRNRRLAVAGGATAVVVAAAALVTWLPSADDKPDVVDDPNERSSTYEEVRLPVEEVEERCSVLLNHINDTEDLDYVLGRAEGGVAVSGAQVEHFVETREGSTAYLVPVGERWQRGEPRYEAPGGIGFLPGGAAGLGDDGGRWTKPNTCVIPQADQVAAVPDALAAPMPDGSDADAVVELCAAQTGYDLRGWERLAVGRLDDIETVALLMSANGYVATCSLIDDGLQADLVIDPEPYLDEDGDPIPAGPGDLRVGVSYGPGVFTEARVLRGLPNGYTVSFEADGEVLAETTTNRGAYLISFRAPRNAVVTGRLTDPDGTVVHEAVISE